MERLRYMEAIGGRMLRAVLAIALVAYLFVPASVSFAEAGDGSGATGKTEQVPEAVQSEKGDASKDGAAESGQPKSGEGASAVQASVDLTALWESDHPRIEAAGEYVLAGDVHAGQPLVVALPAGAIAKVDLAGFSAVVEAEEGDKAPTCAIDLSANAGEIVFVDSAYDEDADAMASITLKTADSTAATAVVRSVQNASTLDSEPSASFEHVRLASDASVKSLDSFGASHTVVKTGAEPGEDKRRARDAAARIAFKGCAFEVNVDERLTVENRAEAISRGMTRGAESVIDAEVAGITLAGPTSAAMKAGSRDAAPTTPALLSRFAATYALAPDFEVASEGQALVFGYPSEAKADASDVGEAVVALPEARSTISAKAAGSIAAAEGYDLKLDAAPDGKPGYAGVSLVAKKAEAPSGDSPAAPVPEAGAPADEPSAVEQATAAAPHIYADYLAAHADEAVYVEEIATQAQDVDLNSSWAALDGGLASTYTITSAGTYYLSDDLSASNGIAIDAPGKDVRIELRGHALTLNGTGSAAQKTMVSIAAAKSVTFDGSAASGLSEIKSAGNADVWGISSNASGCAVRANDLAVTLSSSTNAQRNLATHAVRVASGSLELSRCTLNMLMGNQTLNSASLLQSASEPPSAVFAASGASSVVLEDCTVVGEGSQGVSCSLDDTTSLGNAYALYSQAASTKVAGGTYRALSALGNATCLHGAHLEIASSASADAVSLEADAGQLASGILSTAQASVSVEAPLSFTVASGYEGRADSEAALRSTVEGGFVFGECASSASARYPVLLMTATGDLASANSAGSVIGTFSASLDDAGVSAVLAALGNALGSGCSVGRDLLGRACFTFDNASPANAVASVTHAGASAYYPTLGSALAALGGGETLTLLCDVDAMNVAVADGAVIDLNGHEVGFLEYSAQGAGGALTVKNGSIAGTGAVNGSRASVYHHAGSALVLDDLEITATGSDAVVYGVYGAAGAGALTMSDTAVYVCASRTSAGAGAYGIGMANGGPALTLEHDDIRVSTASAGVPVYGVSCANGLAMSQGAIVARGATGTTGAIFAGGEVSVEGADLDVRTTGTSSGSYGFGIWGRTANPQATSVSVRSCSISVQSSADLRGSTYACLLAATSDASSSPIAWTLSGENVLASSSGLTFGLGMGNITLGDDFELGSGSDGKLVVAQSRIEGNAGFVIEGSPSSARLAQLAALFAARDGSYYSGWSLGADQEASRLVWAVPGAPSEGAVTLVRGGSAQSGHACVTDALEAAQAGDTLRLNCDVAESGTYAVAQSDLTLDLNGHDLVLNTGGMKASSSGGYDGIAFTGDGTLLVKGGSLDIRMGAPSEIARVAQVPYRGVSVTGGGRLSIASDATLNVSYVGSTASAASQRSVTLSGIVVTDGAVALDGALSVTGSASDGGYGSMQTHGILSQPDEGRTADVAVGEKAKVSVDSAAAPITAKNAYYVESTYNATTNDGPTGVREIAIDPDADPVLYQDVIDIFQQRATYDDPNDSNDRNGLSTGVYYLLDAALSREGAWYDGLRIWAYSDQVAVADVGKLDVVVPAHVFISSPYDTLPQAYGIASDAQAQGTSQVTVQGGVAVACSHGEASALMAAGEASWRCEGAELAAFADDTVHPIAQGSFDLRDFVDFSPAQSAAIA
ncbi:MAG: hypothetical protein IJ087_15675 [Eggerthellaceae bacterium]|nr:hypothetical protein [Eggerthellaceae bacterium]